MDEVYAAMLVHPAEALAVGGRRFDAALAATARVIGYLPRAGGAAVRPLQNGLVQFYALGMALGLGVLLSVVVFRSAR